MKNWSSFIFIMILFIDVGFAADSTKDIDSLKIEMEQSIIDVDLGKYRQIVRGIKDRDILANGRIAYRFYELYKKCKIRFYGGAYEPSCIRDVNSGSEKLSAVLGFFSSNFQEKASRDIEDIKSLAEVNKKRSKDKPVFKEVRAEDLDDLVDFTIRPSDFKAYENIGVTEDSAKKWFSLHQTVMMVKEWRNNGVCSPDTAELWLKKGITFENIEKWSGVSLESADEWLKVADLKVDVSNYISAGAKPDELKGWLDYHYTYGYESFEGTLEYDEIKKYNAVHVKPSFVFAMKKQGLSVDDIVKQWKNVRKNCKEILPQDELYSANPYATKGKCYEYVGSSIQLLSKNSGLYEGDGVSFVSISNGIIPKAVIGVAKSSGAYTYRSTMGAKQTVAKLSLVQFAPFQD